MTSTYVDAQSDTWLVSPRRLLRPPPASAHCSLRLRLRPQFCRPERKYGLQSTTTIDLVDPAEELQLRGRGANASGASAGLLPISSTAKGLLLKAVARLQDLTISGKVEYGYRDSRKEGWQRVVADLSSEYARSVLGRRVRQAQELVGEVRGVLSDRVVASLGAAAGAAAAGAGQGLGTGGAGAGAAEEAVLGGGGGDDGGEDGGLLGGMLGRIRARVQQELQARRRAMDALLAAGAGRAAAAAQLRPLSSGVAEVFREVAADGVLRRLLGPGDSGNSSIRALVQQRLQQLLPNSTPGSTSGPAAGGAPAGGGLNATAKWLARQLQQKLRGQALLGAGGQQGLSSTRQVIASHLVQEVVGREGGLKLPAFGLGAAAAGDRNGLLGAVMRATEKEAAAVLLAAAGSPPLLAGLDEVVAALKEGLVSAADVAASSRAAAAAEAAAVGQQQAGSDSKGKPTLAKLLEDIWAAKRPLAAALQAVREQSRLSAQVQVRPFANLQVKKEDAEEAKAG
jgi:hypothetical protein